MCLTMFVFLWLVMLTAWWRCADASSHSLTARNNIKKARGERSTDFESRRRVPDGKHTVPVRFTVVITTITVGIVAP